MGTGQMMLTILAMVLLSVVILNIQKGFYYNNISMANSRYDILAVSVANSIIEDATGLRFDDYTAVHGSFTNPNVCTASASLGIESGESRTNPKAFNDFDDYNCYNTAANAKLDTIIVVATTNPKKMIIFNSICKVDYVLDTNPSQTTASQTNHKRIRIWTYCQELKDPKTNITDTIKLSTVYSYWKF